LVDLNEPQQTHKIVDGDTLPGLSQQFLGRPDRYMEIFDYNRDVLRSPDVLPIGAELRIPSRLSLPSTASANPPSIASSPASAPAAKAAPLVPLVTPSAQPASSQSSNAHTYKVQPGDNLIDIARKVYGDGRRNEDLYEANRRIMRNPGDLKPGMVLTVP
jgi:nucleoid-associated protein YgaU